MERWLRELDDLIIFFKNVDWSKDVYVTYLAQTYHYVKYSTRLLAYSASQISVDENNYFYQCIRHVSEEKGHEILAKKDIEALGYNLEDFKEYSITKAFYQSQYFYIVKDAYSFLGYVFALELAATQLCEWLKEHAIKNFGARTASFMAVHAADDIEHIQNVFKLIETLDQKSKNIVWENFCQSKDILVKIIEECIRQNSISE